jgi:hypothetical protein
MSSVSGIPINPAAGDLDPNLIGLGLSRTASNSPANFQIPLFSATGIFNVTSLSFAIGASGTGFTSASLLYSTNGGTSFTTLGGPLAIQGSGTGIVGFTVPDGTTLNIPSLVMEIQFNGGASNGANIQNVVDNIQVNGTIGPAGVPETGTTFSLFGLSLMGLGFLRRKLC